MKIFDNSGISGPVLVVNCADSFNRFKGFLDQQDE